MKTIQENFTEARPFNETLRELRGGKTHDELSDNLREIIAAVQDTGKPGRLRLIIYVTPEKGMSESHQVSVRDEIDVTIPKHDRPSTLFFVTEECDLSRKDPRALDLGELKELKEV